MELGRPEKRGRTWRERQEERDFTTQQLRRRKSPPRNKLDPLFSSVFDSESGTKVNAKGRKRQRPIRGGESSKATIGDSLFGEKRSLNEAVAAGNSVAERDRLARGDLLVRDLTLDNKQHGFKFKMSSCGKWIDTALQANCGVTRGWLLWYTPDHEWDSYWVTLDPGMQIVSVQPTQHQYEKSTERMFPIQARSSVLRTGNWVAAKGAQAFFTFRVQTLDTNLMFAAADESIMNQWMVAFRDSVPKPKSCADRICTDYCQESKFLRKQRLAGGKPDPILKSLPRATKKKLDAPLQEMDKYFYYDYYEQPSQAPNLRQAALHTEIDQDGSTSPGGMKPVLDDCSFVYRPCQDPSSPDGETEWQVLRRDDPELAASIIQASVRSYLVRCAMRRQAREKARKRAAHNKRIRESHLRKLLALAPHFTTKNTKTIQRVYRGVRCRRELRRKHQAAAKIQRNLLQCWRQKRFARERKVILIQAKWRSRMAKRTLEHRRAAIHLAAQKLVYVLLVARLTDRCAAAIKIQTVSRPFLVRRLIKRSIARATCIQALWRKHRAQTAFLQQRLSAIAIQACWRGWQCYKTYRRDRAAFLRIKKRLIRRVLEKRRARQLESVVKISTWFRARFQARRFHRQKQAAIFVQTTWRSAARWRWYTRVQSAALRVNAFARRVPIRNRFVLRKKMIVVIQAFARGPVLGPLQFGRRKRAQIKMQAFARLCLAKWQARILRAAVRIQSRGRVFLCRTRFLSMRTTCLKGFICFQKNVRGALVRGARIRSVSCLGNAFRATMETSSCVFRGALFVPGNGPTLVRINGFRHVIEGSERFGWHVLFSSALHPGFGVWRSCQISVQTLSRMLRYHPRELSCDTRKPIRTIDIAKCVVAMAAEPARARLLESWERELNVQNAASTVAHKLWSAVLEESVRRVADAFTPQSFDNVHPRPCSSVAFHPMHAKRLHAVVCAVQTRRADELKGLVPKAMHIRLENMPWFLNAIQRVHAPDAPGLPPPALILEHCHTVFSLTRAAEWELPFTRQLFACVGELLGERLKARYGRVEPRSPSTRGMYDEEEEEDDDDDGEESNGKSQRMLMEPGAFVDFARTAYGQVSDHLTSAWNVLDSAWNDLQRVAERTQNLGSRVAEQVKRAVAELEDIEATGALYEAEQALASQRAKVENIKLERATFYQTESSPTSVDELGLRRAALVEQRLTLSREKALRQVQAAQQRVKILRLQKVRLEEVFRSCSFYMGALDQQQSWMSAVQHWILAECGAIEHGCMAFAESLCKSKLEHEQILPFQLLGALASRYTKNYSRAGGENSMPGSFELNAKRAQVAQEFSDLLARYAVQVAPAMFSLKTAQKLAELCNDLTLQAAKTARMLDEEISSHVFACRQDQQRILDDLEAKNLAQVSHITENEDAMRALVRELNAEHRFVSNFWWARFTSTRVLEQYIEREKDRIFDSIYPPLTESEASWDSLSSKSSDETASKADSDYAVGFDHIQQSHLSPKQNQMFQEDGAFFQMLLDNRETNFKHVEAEESKQDAAAQKMNRLAAGKTTLHLKPFIQAVAEETVSMRYVRAKVAHTVKATIFPRQERLKRQTAAVTMIQCLVRRWLAFRELAKLKTSMGYAARVHHAARVLQGMYRMVWIARPTSHALLMERYKTFQYPELDLFFFYDSIDKKAIWDKSALMKRLNVQPKRAWGEPEYLPSLEDL